MKILTIKKLIIQNFKGIKNVELEFNEAENNIYGKNGSGKTSILDAISWLFFNEPYTPTTNFNPKPLDANNNEIHHLTTKVEMICDINDREYKFTKLLQEKWSKKRGSLEKTFNKNFNTYYIDDIIMPEKEFTDYISEKIGNKQIVKTLCNPYVSINGIHWTELRDILLNTIPTINTIEIVKNNDTLSELLPYIEKTNEINIKNNFQQILSECDKKMIEIDTKIDTIKSFYKEVNSDKTLDEITKIYNENDAKLKTLKQNSSNDASKNLKIETLSDHVIKGSEILNNINTQIYDLERKIKSDIHSKKEKIESQMNKLKNEEKDCHIKLEYNNKKIEFSNEQSAIFKRKYEMLKEEYLKEKNTTFDEHKAICPTCKRPYDQKEADNMKNEFEKNKTKKLIDLVQESNKIVENNKKEKEFISGLIKDNKSIQIKLNTIQNSIKECKEEINNIKEDKSLLDKLKELNAKRDTTVSKLDTIKADLIKLKQNTTTGSDIQEIQKLQETNDELSKMLINLRENQKLDQQIKLLKDSKPKIVEDNLQANKMLNLLMKLSELKAIALENEINKKFKNIKFMLFEEFKNGNIKETCKVLVPSDKTGALVPASNANFAGRVTAGIELIEMLSEHYGLKMPIFIDMRGEVTDIGEPKTQIINLYVSPEDHILRCNDNIVNELEVKTENIESDDQDTINIESVNIDATNVGDLLC